MKLSDFIVMYRYDNTTRYQPILKRIWIIYTYLFPKIDKWERERLAAKKNRDSIKNAKDAKFQKYQENLKTCYFKSQL